MLLFNLYPIKLSYKDKKRNDFYHPAKSKVKFFIDNKVRLINKTSIIKILQYV